MKVLVVIPTYNPGIYKEYVKKNIKLILDNNHNYDIRVLLIDNSTDKEDINELLINFKKCHKFDYIINNQNNGPGAAFNQGIIYGIKNMYDYCYFVDQDSIINLDSIYILLDYAAKGFKFSFLASKVICEENYTNLYYFRGRLNKNMSLYYVVKKEYRKEKVYINAAGYTGLFLNLEIIRKNDIYINENFFIGYDDYDFTYRLSKIERGYLVTNSYITHPNKRIKYNSLIAQFFLNYLRQFIYSNDFRKQKSAENYIILINKYGSNFSKFIKLNILVKLMRYFDKNVYEKTNTFIKKITANERV